jgi:hypothetical protein
VEIGVAFAQTQRGGMLRCLEVCVFEETTSKLQSEKSSQRMQSADHAKKLIHTMQQVCELGDRLKESEIKVL